MNKMATYMLLLTVLVSCAPQIAEETPPLVPLIPPQVEAPGPGGMPLEPLYPAIQPYEPSDDELDIMLRELRGAFDFFWLTANSEQGSPGFGLIPDRMPAGPGISSIASVGYGLAAICIGVERGWITREEGAERVMGTFVTLRDNVEGHRGFFYHFLDIKSAKRVWNCELSVIDTAICMNGVLFAGEYFGGEIKELAHKLYERVEWDWYVNPVTQQFYMGWNNDRFEGAWDVPSEQFMMYFLGSGSPTFPTDGDLFYRFRRPVGRYGSFPDYHYSYINPLFVFQFSHAWYDLRNMEDTAGIDWYKNSVVAVLGNRQYGIDNAERYATGVNDWGFSACDGPGGYSGNYGAPPSMGTLRNDGTVAAYGAAGSIPFMPRHAVPALVHQYGITGLTGEYGLKDAYNLKENWIARDTIGIDKGVAMLMIENYLTGFIWELMGSIPAVQKGIEACELSRIENTSGLLYGAVLGGGRNVGDLLSVEYELYGADGILDISWFVSSDAAGADPVAVSGATDRDYIIRPEDNDKFIFAVVTPTVIKDGQYVGLPGVRSNLTPRILP